MWRDATETERANGLKDTSDSTVTNYRTVVLDPLVLMSQLAGAPKEGVEKRLGATTSQTGVELLIPMPHGSVGRFRVFETAVMAPELAAKFPKSKTWAGQGIDDPSASIFLDHGSLGFHAMVLSYTAGRLFTDRVFIDPIAVGNVTLYKSYFARELKLPESGMLKESAPLYELNLPEKPTRIGLDKHLNKVTLSQLRTYRMAVATTEGYTNYFGGTVQNGLDAVLAAINRVSGLYKTEIGVAFQLVANNDQIIFTNSNLGPYSGRIDSKANLNLNQTTIDTQIGSANYDIGHVFSTNGAGLASMGVVCTSSKARGATGKGSPTGDAFWVDYVAHEVGHQFKAGHTFNSVAGGGCDVDTIMLASSYEPGSGSSIMGYAGICVDDLQDQSDPYFHTKSFEEIQTFIQDGAGSTCGTVDVHNNHPPVPATGTGGFTIPISTPFTLTGSANDPDGNALTYSWEEMDLGTGKDGYDTLSAPFFRIWPPSASPVRTFPRMAELLNGTAPLGENLPTVSTTLNFRLMTRDNQAAGGGVAYATYAFNTSAGAGPFAVTAPSSLANWPVNSQQQVTWNVANTDTAPVNCAAVDVLLSLDQGNSFSVVLAQGVPNNGSAAVTAPNRSVNNARVKVACSSHVAAGSAVQFFALSNAFKVGMTAATLIDDGYESGSGWTSTSTYTPSGKTAAQWTVVNATSNPTTGARTGTWFAKFNSSDASKNAVARFVPTGGTYAIPATAVNANLSYWLYHSKTYTSSDTVQVQVSTDGVAWSNVGTLNYRYDSSVGWKQATVDLLAYAGQTIRIGFLGTSQFGENIYIDDVLFSTLSSTVGAVPGAPAMGAASAGNAQGTVSFTAPADAGSSPIDLYRVTCNATATATGSGSPITVSGLVNGMSYTCTVAAHNSVGWGGESGSSASFTPKASQTISAGVAPTVRVGGTGTVTATATSGLPVSFSVTPANGYCSLSGTTVTGLAQGICSVYADQAGNAAYLAAPQILMAFSISPVSATEPSAPTITSISAGPGRATINFTPPSNTGGAPIVSYTASCSAPGKATRTATGVGSPLVVSGLTEGVVYSCTLTASNGTFSSTASASATVTPQKNRDIVPVLMLLLD